MEIEVGDVIKTPHRRLEVLTVIHEYVIVRDIDFREAGKKLTFCSRLLTCVLTGFGVLRKESKTLTCQH